MKLTMLFIAAAGAVAVLHVNAEVVPSDPVPAFVPQAIADLKSPLSPALEKDARTAPDWTFRIDEKVNIPFVELTGRAMSKLASAGVLRDHTQPRNMFL